MRRCIRLAVCCALLLPWSVAWTVEPPAAPAAPHPAVPETVQPDRRQKVREVTLDPNAKLPVCKRYVPTGSRIATERCEAPQDSLTASEQAEQDTTRRDIAEMRALQTMRDQARAQAQAEALRRAAGGR